MAFVASPPVCFTALSVYALMASMCALLRSFFISKLFYDCLWRLTDLLFIKIADITRFGFFLNVLFWSPHIWTLRITHGRMGDGLKITEEFVKLLLIFSQLPHSNRTGKVSNSDKVSQIWGVSDISVNLYHTVWPPRSPSSSILLSLLPPAGSRVNNRTVICEEDQASSLITKFAQILRMSRSARCHTPASSSWGPAFKSRRPAVLCFSRCFP